MASQIQFISAGAGSGKTYTLTEILHRELQAGQVRPEGVLATTFTNKAASELRERVRSHLIGRGSYALANAIGQARIGTVNSVCAEMLQRFAFEAGLPTEQRVLDEVHSAQLLGEAIDLVMEQEDLDELLRVARRLGLAYESYGSDKPPYLAALGSLVNQARSNAIDAEQLRDFGDRNADILLKLLPAPCGEDLDAVLLAEIRKALPAVRSGAEGGKKNTNKYLDLLQEVERELADARMTWAQWSKLAKEEPEKGLLPVIQPVATAAGRYSEHPKLHADLRNYLRAIFGAAADVLEAYADLKKQLGALDFTDQERQLLDILDRPSVADTLREELDLLMVDEFQDTSPIQLALFLKMAGFADKVIWVGDVKQAIYGFRGSDTVLMKSVLAALPALGGTKSVLEHSWRSRPSLVALVNQVFGEAFAGLNPEEVHLRPKREELPATAAVEDWLLAGSKKELHVAALAEGIADMVARGVQVQDSATKRVRPVRLADIAVLARANSTVKDIAKALSARGIASSTSQPGLLEKPEVVLALALLRRLADDRDTLATAEILSLADGAEPEQWLTDRLQWLAALRTREDSDEPVVQWKEDGTDAHPLLLAVKELRSHVELLAPREAVELVLTRCGLARRVIQWQQDPQQARLRLANLDRLIELAVEYEEECATTRVAASLSGLLLWLQYLAEQKADTLPQPAIDAVQVMTHHAAKGLEWPVVVLCDLAGDVQDRIWDIQAESGSAFDAHRPLQDRFLRYWPWPFGSQNAELMADLVEGSPQGLAVRGEAIEEAKRLLYVSMTRARDVLVFARPAKKCVGEWMSTVSLDNCLPASDDGPLPLKDGSQVSFRRRSLSAEEGGVVAEGDGKDLVWFEEPASPVVRPRLSISPSSLEGAKANVVENVAVGVRIDSKRIEERSVLGDALHACIAADLASPGQPLGLEEVAALLERFEVDGGIDGKAVHGQLRAIREWIATRWPEAQAVVELPMARAMNNGQRVVGRTDLLLRTGTGWVLIDHKTTPQGSAQWNDLADTHAGQLAAYREMVETVSGEGVGEMWLVLPVAGAALRVEVERPSAA